MTTVSAPPHSHTAPAESKDGSGASPALPTASGDPMAARLHRIKSGILARFPRDKTPKITLLERAFADAKQHHEGQVRKSGEPYILHPYRVALMASESGVDVETVIIALLHDVIEDTEMTKEEVQARYGDWLADVVDGLTKVPKDGESPRDAGVASYRKLISSTIKDLRTAQVKLFDRLDNMRDLGFLERHRQRRIARETLGVFVPMAQRLGMQDIADELTALCFRYLYPRRFNEVLKQLKQRLAEQQAKVAGFTQLLESILVEQGFRDFTVKPRTLQISDFIHKDPPRSNPLLGFTVNVPTAVDCYRALGALHIRCRVMPNSIRDYISNPKPNRYQALHSQVFMGGESIALVICSHAMEAVNRSGILANWEGSLEELHRYYQSYLELLDQYTDTDDLRMEDVLRHAQLETLQVFTPKGKLLSLPQGATAVDFAFAIHTDLGLHCTGARLGGEWISPFQELKDGEVVEVLSDPSVFPAPDWLDHVRTTRAKLAIRRYLKGQANQRAQELGRKLLALELGRIGMTGPEFFARPEFTEALVQRGLSLPQFLQQVGTRRIALRRFLLESGLASKEAVARLEAPTPQGLLSRYWKPRSTAPEPLLEVPEGGDGFLTLSPCCQPLAGDAILGVQTDSGIRVHRSECTEVLKADPAAVIGLAWEAGSRKQPYALELRILDRAGMIYKISKVMRDLNVSIHDLSLERLAPDEQALLRVALEPITGKTYQKIVSRLRAIKEVLMVSQVNTERHRAPTFSPP
jgi:GTP pyrophosphokinase